MKKREEHEEMLERLKYKLASMYCQAYHKEEMGIKLHQQLMERVER